MRISSRTGGYLAVAASVAVLSALTACSSSSGGSGGSSSSAGAAVVSSLPQTSSAPASSAPASSSAAVASSSLTGDWSGHYTGTFTGTFTLNWTQSGSNLTGTIKLSSDNNAATPINGSVQNNHIKFGTVGSSAVQYEGTVSGSSMSGTWKIAPVNGVSAGGGNWSGTKG